MTEHTPVIDFENLPTPSEGFLVTQFITVRSVARSRAFYSEVLGGQVVLEENPRPGRVTRAVLAAHAQAMPLCPEGGLGAITHADPLENPREVCLDGPFAYLEAAGDQLVG